MEAGFGSLSRFNAAFRQLCGCAPRAVPLPAPPLKRSLSVPRRGEEGEQARQPLGLPSG